MKLTTQISEKDFESLLNWLSDDPEEAGIEYENIRQGLLRYFRFKGCADCYTLVDETINRVANKLDSLNLQNEYKKITIFYGFATNIYKEYVRDFLKSKAELNAEALKLANENEFLDEELDCMEACLKELSEEERFLIEQYFRKDKSEKIILRKKLAKKYKITPNALNVRIYRIRKRLKGCIKDCVKKKKL